MLSDTHREQIRALVDGVDDPAMSDVILRSAAQPAPVRRRRTLVAACAVLVVGLLVLGVTLAVRHDEHAPHVRVQPGGAPTLPESCVVDAPNASGCTMSPEAASRYLGFRARHVRGVPEGWVLERQRLRVFRHPESDDVDGFSADRGQVPVFNQIWTPPGVRLDAAAGCPSRLQVRQRPALPNESDAVGPIDVGNGRRVFGSLAEPSTCAGANVVSTMIYWFEDGIAFTLNAVNVDRGAVAGLVASLSRS